MVFMHELHCDWKKMHGIVITFIYELNAGQFRHILMW